MAFVYVPNGVHMPDWTPADDRRRLRPPADPRAAAAGPGRPPRPQRAGARPGPGPRRRRRRPRPGDGQLPDRPPPAEDRTGPTSAPGSRSTSSPPRRSARRPGSPRWRSAARGAGDSGACDHGYSCAYQVNLSWRGESTPGGQGDRPPARLRSPLRRPGPGEADAGPRPPASARPKSLLDFVGRGRPAAPRQPRRRRPPQARRVPDRRPRDRAADRRRPAGRRGRPGRRSPGRPASRPTTASTSGSWPTCWCSPSGPT